MRNRDSSSDFWSGVQPEPGHQRTETNDPQTLFTGLRELMESRVPSLIPLEQQLNLIQRTEGQGSGTIVLAFFDERSTNFRKLPYDSCERQRSEMRRFRDRALCRRYDCQTLAVESVVK